MYEYIFTHRASLVAQLDKKIRLQCGRPGFDPRVGKIPWGREWLPTPVFQPGEFHGLYDPWGHKESDTTERLLLHFIFIKCTYQCIHKVLNKCLFSSFYTIFLIELYKDPAISTNFKTIQLIRSNKKHSQCLNVYYKSDKGLGCYFTELFKLLYQASVVDTWAFLVAQ